MKQIKEKDAIYLEEYDIHVKRYLDYSEVYAIARGVMKFDDWDKRQINYDVLVLHFCTDIKDEEISKNGHELLHSSGLIDTVKSQILNLDDIDKCIKYYTSIERSLTQIVNYIDNSLKVKNGRSK